MGNFIPSSFLVYVIKLMVISVRELIQFSHTTRTEKHTKTCQKCQKLIRRHEYLVKTI